MRNDVLNTLPPGVYIEQQEQHIPSLELAPTAITGFMGICERGPVDHAVEIHSVDEFHKKFGNPVPGGFLAPAITGFFKNGGKVCHVIRIGHKGTARRKGDTTAALTLLDHQGKPTLKITATSPGSWGDDIVISANVMDTKVRTLLTLDAPKGSSVIRVSSTHGIRKGSLIRLISGDQTTYRYVEDINGKELIWSERLPLTEGFSVAGPTYVETVDFQISVKYKNTREVYSGLSLFRAAVNYAPRVINSRSDLIRVIDLGSTSPLPENLPAEMDLQRLEGGSENLNMINPGDFIGLSSEGEERRGLQALAVIEGLELIAAPDLMFLHERNKDEPGLPFSSLSDIRVVQDAMVTHCENKRDRFAILDSPFPDDMERTEDWRQEFDTDHGALYFPWLRVNFENQIMLIPPSGHVAGLYAGNDEEVGVHKTPANKKLDYVIDVSYVLWEEDVGRLNGAGINSIRTLPGVGITVWGGRTLSSDTAHRYINVRRTTSAVIRSLDLFMQWVVFEPNTRGLWKRISRQVGYFLTTLWKQGYLKGRTPEEAFFVKCDDENNPPSLRENGILAVDIGISPVKPAEYILFRMAQEMQEVVGE